MKKQFIFVPLRNFHLVYWVFVPASQGAGIFWKLFSRDYSGPLRRGHAGGKVPRFFYVHPLA